MSQRDPEYDRFGPWVLEVSDDDPPPPLFLPYLTRTELALLSVKIPRLISRRDAHPGMDLYDYLVSLYEEDILILERIAGDGRAESAVQAQTIAYRDIRFLRLGENLLRGTLYLAMADRSYELAFNTVSRDLMERLVDLVRARYRLDDPPAKQPGPGPVELPELSFYFMGLLDREAQAGSGMRPLAAQADTAMREQETSTWRRLLFGLVDKRLLESLHYSDGRELKIVSRGQAYAYRWQTAYGKSVCYIPLANVSAVEWKLESGDAGVTRLVLRSDAGECPYLFTEDNPTLGPYRAALERLTRRR